MRAHPFLKMTTVPFLVSVALTGCSDSDSGSGSTTSETTDPTENTTNLSGKVADGYLEGATVCLDLNDNSQCDDDEPQATSGSSGEFTLENVTAEQKADYAIVAEVTESTIDKDNGQAVQQPYSLTGVPGEHDFVSPVTTMVKARMMANPNLSRDEAKKQVASEVGRSADDVVKDYVGEDEGLHDVARAIRKTVQTVEETLKGEWGLGSDGLSESNRELLRYAVTKIVSSNVANITGQVAAGTDSEKVDIGDVDVGDKQATEEELEANESAERSSVLDMVDKYNEFVVFDADADVPVNFQDNGDGTGDSLTARRVYISRDAFAMGAEIEKMVLEKKDLPMDGYKESFTEDELEDVEVADGALQFSGDFGADISLSNAAITDLEGKTYSLGSPVLAVDDDITATPGLSDKEVTFEAGDRVFKWASVHGEVDPSEFSWSELDCCKSVEDSNASSIGDWVKTHSDGQNPTDWFSDGQIYFETSEQRVIAMDGRGVVGEYSFDTANGERYLLIDTYISNKPGMIAYHASDGIRMADFNVAESQRVMNVFNPSAAKKIADAIKDWHYSSQ